MLSDGSIFNLSILATFLFFVYTSLYESFVPVRKNAHFEIHKILVRAKFQSSPRYQLYTTITPQVHNCLLSMIAFFESTKRTDSNKLTYIPRREIFEKLLQIV